eukprot:10147066-Karenia_brevis.AAC.1
MGPRLNREHLTAPLVSEVDHAPVEVKIITDMRPEVREIVQHNKEMETYLWEMARLLGRCVYGLEPWPMRHELPPRPKDPLAGQGGGESSQ